MQFKKKKLLKGTTRNRERKRIVQSLVKIDSEMAAIVANATSPAVTSVYLAKEDSRGRSSGEGISTEKRSRSSPANKAIDIGGSPEGVKLMRMINKKKFDVATNLLSGEFFGGVGIDCFSH